jgi:RNA polymerase sigma-70 factor (ECF subfamily)
MAGAPCNVESDRAERLADHLRAAVERDYDSLCRRVGLLVYKSCGALRRDEVAERVQEVLDESVRRALAAAERFDAGRSASAWLLGIAARVLHEQRRERAARPVPASDLGGDRWREVLEGLYAVPDGEAAVIRLDVRQALARLGEAERAALERRYFDGLDGEDLARALGAPSAGATRVRVCRAMQALRAQFGVGREEGGP